MYLAYNDGFHPWGCLEESQRVKTILGKRNTGNRGNHSKHLIGIFGKFLNQHESVSHVSVYLMLMMVDFTSFFEAQYEQSLIYMAYMLFYELKASSGH